MNRSSHLESQRLLPKPSKRDTQVVSPAVGSLSKYSFGFNTRYDCAKSYKGVNAREIIEPTGNDA